MLSQEDGTVNEEARGHSNYLPSHDPTAQRKAEETVPNVGQSMNLSNRNKRDFASNKVKDQKMTPKEVG